MWKKINMNNNNIKDITMKKLISLIIISIIISSNVFSQTISIDTVWASEGDYVVVPMRVTNFANVGSITLFISYDQQKFDWSHAMNWNNELLINGQPFAHANNGILAISWFDLNGVDIAQGKLVDLKFKYHGDLINLNFEANCEITDTAANSIGVSYTNGFLVEFLSVAINVSETSICLDSSLQLINSVTGGFGNYTYSWTSNPSGFISSLSEPIVSPDTNTIYHLLVSEEGYSTSDSVIVSIFNKQLSAIGDMFPANGATNQVLPLHFSWFPATNADSYEIKFWADTTLEPLFSRIIYEISYNLIIDYFTLWLDYGVPFYWQVISLNQCYQVPGPIQSFELRKLPDLVADSVEAPASVEAGQQITVKWRVKNIGDGSTLNQEWKDNVYLISDTSFSFNPLEIPQSWRKIGSSSNLTFLDSAQSYIQTVDFTLPANLVGYFYVLVLADATTKVLELTDTNNYSSDWSSQLILINALPKSDLIVTSMGAPLSVFADDTINVTYTIKNVGNASAIGDKINTINLQGCKFKQHCW